MLAASSNRKPPLAIGEPGKLDGRNDLGGGDERAETDRHGTRPAQLDHRALGRVLPPAQGEVGGGDEAREVGDLRMTREKLERPHGGEPDERSSRPPRGDSLGSEENERNPRRRVDHVELTQMRQPRIPIARRPRP